MAEVPKHRRQADWYAYIRGRKKREYDTVILNCGDEGDGKSSVAFLMANQIDPDFSVDNIVFTAGDMIRKARELPRGSVIILDEAVEGAYAGDATTKKNKAFKKFLIICRERCHILIINMPQWGDIDRRVRVRAHYCNWVMKRGWCKAHRVMGLFYVGGDPRLDDLFKFPFAKPVGPKWEKYKALKAAYVTERDEDDDSSLSSPGDVGKRMGELATALGLSGN